MFESLAELTLLLAPYQNVFLYSVDPGSYAIMRPIYESLSREGKKGEWIVDGWCRNRIECEYPFMDWSSFREEDNQLKIGRSCMVLGLQRDVKATHGAIQFCKEKGIDTVFLFDHWANCLPHFYCPDENKLYLPDKICVPDEKARKCVLSEIEAIWKNDLYAENIFVVGHPAIEDSVAAIRSLATYEVEKMREKLGHPDKRIILFLLEPVEDDFGYNSDGSPFLGYNEYTILHHILSQVDLENVQLIIKPHPRQDLGKIGSFLKGYEHQQILLTVNEKLESLIAIADEVWGMTTIALIIALKAGKKIRSFQVGRNDRKENRLHPYFEDNLVL